MLFKGKQPGQQVVRQPISRCFVRKVPELVGAADVAERLSRVAADGASVQTQARLPHGGVPDPRLLYQREEAFQIQDYFINKNRHVNKALIGHAAVAIIQSTVARVGMFTKTRHDSKTVPASPGLACPRLQPHAAHAAVWRRLRPCRRPPGLPAVAAACARRPFPCGALAQHAKSQMTADRMTRTLSICPFW